MTQIKRKSLQELELKYARGGAAKKQEQQAVESFVKDGQGLAPAQPVPIAHLHHNRVLDDGHVAKIKEAMDSGKAMPPVVIDSIGNILDGNHRVAAARASGHSHIHAHEVYDKDDGPMFAEGGDVEGQEEKDGDITKPIPSQIGEGSVLHSLVDTMQKNPQTAPILQAHALALLRANLSAAHAIHSLTGDPSAYGHFQNGARLLSSVLGGNSDAVTALMIGHQFGDSNMNPLAIAPAAIGAAKQAVPGSASE